MVVFRLFYLFFRLFCTEMNPFVTCYITTQLTGTTVTIDKNTQLYKQIGV